MRHVVNYCDAISMDGRDTTDRSSISCSSPVGQDTSHGPTLFDAWGAASRTAQSEDTPSHVFPASRREESQGGASLPAWFCFLIFILQRAPPPEQVAGGFLFSCISNSSTDSFFCSRTVHSCGFQLLLTDTHVLLRKCLLCILLGRT